MENYSLQEIKNITGANLPLKNLYASGKVAWNREFWENATWENFFSGERDAFLFENVFDLPREIKEIQMLLRMIKNMQVEIEIGNEKEIDFLAINILIDFYHRLYIDRTPLEQSYFDDFIHPYIMASTVIRDLWSIKRRKFIVEQIVHYSSLGGNYKVDEDCITELRKFAEGKINLSVWKIYSLSSELPIVSISDSEYFQIQQMISMLSNFNNLGIGFHEKLRDQTDLTKQGADIMHSYGIWFDGYGAFNRLICETAHDMVEEANLEEALISILKKKFVSKGSKNHRSVFNVCFNMLGASRVKEPKELQLEILHDDNLLEKKVALVLRKQKKEQ